MPRVIGKSMNRYQIGGITLVALAAVAGLVMAFTSRHPPLKQCVVTPPTGAASSTVVESQAAKLAAVFNKSDGGTAVDMSLGNVLSAQVQETYAAIPDHDIACGMLFQTIVCAQDRDPQGELAKMLAADVKAVCSKPQQATTTAAAPGGRASASNSSVAIVGDGNTVQMSPPPTASPSPPPSGSHK